MKKDYDLLEQLYRKINKACFTITQDNSITQQYCNDNLSSSETVTLTTVDYCAKRAIVLTSELVGETGLTTIDSYRNLSMYSIQDITLPISVSGSGSVSIAECNYYKLFKPCGKLYPVNLDGIIPIYNPNNSENFQAYTFNEEKAKAIVGYIDSIVSIQVLEENVYLITTTINIQDIYNRPIQFTTIKRVEIGFCNCNLKERNVYQDTNLINEIYREIDNSCFVATQTNTTTESYINNELNIMSFATLSGVDFYNDRAIVLLTTVNQVNPYAQSSSYRSFKEYRRLYNGIITPVNKSSVIPYSPCEYKKLFEKCGGLYPVELGNLVPINDPNNSNTYQAYTFNKKVASSMPNYVSSVITIEKIEKGVYKINSTITTTDINNNEPIQSIMDSTIEISSCTFKEESKKSSSNHNR